jgi:hypothetical protein
MNPFIPNILCLELFDVRLDFFEENKTNKCHANKIKKILKI